MGKIIYLVSALLVAHPLIAAQIFVAHPYIGAEKL
jgi:hypothetical protein